MMRRDPLPISVSSARIHHQEQVICCESVDEQIVDNCSFGSCQCGVLCLVINQFVNVVRRQAVNESDRVCAANIDFTHVGDVEQACVCSGTKMFFDGSGGILN